MPTSPTAGRKRAARVDAETFVRAWMSSSSIPEVSRKTGLTSGACVSRAIQLRRKGVNLPRYRRGKKGLDVAGLNLLIRKMATKKKR